MMKSIAELKRILNAGLLLLLIHNLSFASDLIEPTRTLSSPAGGAGELSVFSEPPQLDVNLDGTQIGKTPVVGQRVEPGIHVIRVKDSATEIYVEPGKSAKLSWFKGAFIEIPAEVIKSRNQQSEEKKEIPHTRMSEQSVEKKEKPDPLYWPLNPKGPIY
jgi:hypothetical protein